MSARKTSYRESLGCWTSISVILGTVLAAVCGAAQLYSIIAVSDLDHPVVVLVSLAVLAFAGGWILGSRRALGSRGAGYATEPSSEP